MSAIEPAGVPPHEPDPAPLAQPAPVGGEPAAAAEDTHAGSETPSSAAAGSVSDALTERALSAGLLARSLGADGAAATSGVAALGGVSPLDLQAERARIEAMVADLDRLEKRLTELESKPIDLDAYLAEVGEAARPKALRLEVGVATRKVRELKTFLSDFAKLCAIMTTARGADLISQKGLEGAWREITGYSFEQYQRNLTPLLAPWRQNGNDWLTDFVGHPLVGFGLASYFRDQGYGRLESYVGAVLGDLVWEFVLEGAAAPVEWNDLLTTGVVGALAGVLLKDARVGPYELSPTGAIDPETGRVSLGLRLRQQFGPGRALSVDVTRSDERTSATGNLELGPVSVYGFAEGRTGDRDPQRFGAGLRIRF